MLYRLFSRINNARRSTRGLTPPGRPLAKSEPRVAVVIKRGTAPDVIDALPAGAWRTRLLTRALSLSVGTHLISVQIDCTNQDPVAADNLATYTPVLSVVGYSLI